MEGDETEFDNALVIDAAFQIIDASLDTKALFQELSTLSSKLQESSIPVTDLLSVTCTQIQENQNGLSKKSILSTPGLAQEVIQLAESHRVNQSAVFQKKLQDKWRVCLSLIKESVQRGVFISSLFTSWISKRGLSIGFLWDLHKIGAYNFETHLACTLKDPKSKTDLPRTLISLCYIVQESDDDNSNVQCQKHILTGVTNLLVNKSFSEDKDSRTKDSKTYLRILDGLLEGIITLPAPANNHHHIYTSPFSDLSGDSVNLQAKRKFARHALSFCLQHQADFIISEHTPSVAEYKPNDTDKFLEAFTKQLLECLSTSESLDVLNHCLKCDQVNSRTTTAFLAAFLQISELSGHAITDYIKTNLATGLQGSDASQVKLGFYIARKCSSLVTTRFPSYRDWFQQTFGEASTSFANSRTSFSFLIKCLTHWVPEDSPEYLKAHIFRRPIIPSRMREVYESYLFLAKTRLDDLKIPIREVAKEDATCDSVGDSSKEQRKIQIQKDVDRSVKVYEETGKIPTTILEASIFRKPYFIGKFLPAILKPRCLPDRPDSRMRLIEEMRKSGRIPSVMFSTYKDGCEREKKNLLEGVFDVDDEGEEMLMSPLEQLQFRLDHFTKEFLQQGDKKVHELLTLVEERVYALVMNRKKVDGHDQDSIEVDLCQSLESCHEQIITRFILSLSRGLKDSQDNTAKHQQAVLWLEKLIAILSRFPALKAALLKYILLCLDKTTVPDGASPDCLSLACISIMCTSRRLSLQVTDQHGLVHNWNNNFMEACHHFLSCSCEEEIAFGLRFFTSYLFHAKQRLDDSHVHSMENDDVIEMKENHFSESQLLPEFLVKKITLLCSRCRLMAGNSTTDTLNQSDLSRLYMELSQYTPLLDSTWWKQTTSMHQPSLEDWVKFELRVNPKRDILTNRLRLSYFWEFCGKFIQDLGFVAVCSSLFHLLADEVTLCQRKDAFLSKDNSYDDFICFLKGLLLQLPPKSGDQSERQLPWLLSTALACGDKSARTRMLSLSLHLHPHLLVVDNKHSFPSHNEEVTQNALDLLDLFSASDLNCGGYFSLDVIIFIIQASANFNHSSFQTRYLCHPAVFTSIVVHRESLKHLRMLTSCPQDFKTLLDNVFTMTERLFGRLESELMDGDEEDEADDWMNASALFGFIICGGNSTPLGDSIVDALSQQPERLSFLWELITTWFVYNMGRSDLSTPLQTIHQSIVLRHPTIVTTSLSPRQISSLSNFRQHLGLQPEHENIRTFSILRQCSTIPASSRDIPVSVSSALSVPLVSVYVTLLEGIDNTMNSTNKVPVDDLASISSWLQSLVSCCHPSQLCKLNLNTLHDCDALLYRKIYLKTLKS